MISESKINPNNKVARESLKDLQEKVITEGEIYLHNTTGFPRTTPCQPGGVCTVVSKRILSRIGKISYDKCGRWIKITVYGRTSNLQVYNVYRVNHGHNKLGETTAWRQQKHLLQKLQLEALNRKNVSPMPRFRVPWKRNTASR